MGINARLIDYKSTTSSRLDKEGNLNVVIHPHPPIEDDSEVCPFRFNMNNEGSDDMTVDGSTNSVDFVINSDPTLNTYIKTISILLAGSGATLADYANIAALTNGTQLILDTEKTGQFIIANSLKTNLEWVRLCHGNPSFGTGTLAFKADINGNGKDSYLPVLDFSSTFGLQYGIKLARSKKDKLIIRINDDLTSVTEHNAIAYGFYF